MLQSYLQDSWISPQSSSDIAVAVYDAVTGDEICRVSADGLDIAAALDHARRVGGPALRELTFHQRAGLLDAVAAAVREHRDQLYALSTKAGATCLTRSSTSTAASAS